MAEEKDLKSLDKEELEALVAERGLKVPENPSKKELLKALTDDEAAKKGAGAGDDEEEEGEDPEKPEKTDQLKSDFADVVKDGVYIRTFSKIVHGADWKSNLDEFVNSTNQEISQHNANPKRQGALRPLLTILEPGKLKALKVTYQVRNKVTKAWEDKTDVLSGAGFRERALALGVEKATSVFVA